MAFTEDLAPFFNVNDFGVSVTVTRGAFTVTFNGILTVNDDEVMGMNATRPFLICRSSDVREVRRGDRVSIGGLVFTVLKNSGKADGTSGVYLEASS